VNDAVFASVAREFHADPLATFAACRALTSRLALRHYHPRDFTVLAYR